MSTRILANYFIFQTSEHIEHREVHRNEKYEIRRNFNDVLVEVGHYSLSPAEMNCLGLWANYEEL